MKKKLTYDKCKEEVSKYNNYFELYNSDVSIIRKIKKKGWLDLISHWDLPYSYKNPKWTYDKCKEEISNLTYINELQGTSLGIALRKNGWFDELTSHLIRKGRNPYTLEEIKTEASKYSTRVEFQKKSSGCYNSALRKGIIDEVCLHMGNPMNHKKYTKEEILESSRKYKSQKEWKEKEQSIFNSARNYNKKNASNEDKEFWLLCINHMEYIYKPNGYWTYEKCKEITEKYTIYSDFRKDYSNVCNIIHKYGWNDLLDHMVQITKSGKLRQFSEQFDTIEKCTEEALKYKSRSEMCKNSSLAYRIIQDNNWEKICLSHMKKQVNLKERFVYVCEFNTTTPKYAYVGITCQIERRKNAHLYGTENGKSSVFEKINEINIIPDFKILTPIPIKEEDAPEMESKWIDDYRNRGYELLNKTKAGSLGGMRIKYNYNYFVKIKDGCKTIEEFCEKMPYWVRQLAIKNGWWTELTSNLVKTKITPVKWNIDNALEESKNFKNISELQKKKSGLYKFLSKNGLLKVAFPKTTNELKIEKYKNKEECHKEALKYKTKKDFRLNSKRFYESSKKYGWFDDICSHMVTPEKISKPSKWTYDSIKENSLNCKSRSEFQKKYPAAYKTAIKLKLLDDLFPVNEKISKPSKWTYDLMKEKSLECKNVSEFQKKYSGAYKVSKKLGHLYEFYPK